MANLNRWKTSYAILMICGALSLSPASAQTYTVLYNFDGVHGESPSYPNNVIQGIHGKLYGMTAAGGKNGDGVLFRVTPGDRYDVLNDFDGIRGSTPTGLSLGNAGYIYGTTQTGGTSGYGVAFRLNPNGQRAILHDFLGCSDGGNPFAPPIQAINGNFYGTTGGRCGGVWAGSAYKITRSGDFTSFGYVGGGAVLAPFVQDEGGIFTRPHSSEGLAWATCSG